MKLASNICILTFSSLYSLQAFSQSNKPEIFLSIGPNYSSLYNKYITSDLRKTKIGTTVQLGIRYFLNKKFDLSIAFLYERKGLRSNSLVSYYDPTIDSLNCLCTTSSGFLERNTSIDYLIFAPQIKYNVVSDKFQVGLGSFFSQIMKARTDSRSLWNNNSYSANSINTFKPNDIGISLSIDYRFSVDKFYFGLGVLNNLGLYNIDKTGSQTKSNSSSLNFKIYLN